jgi:hypothetical protein
VLGTLGAAELGLAGGDAGLEAGGLTETELGADVGRVGGVMAQPDRATRVAAITIGASFTDGLLTRRSAKAARAPVDIVPAGTS